MRILLLISLLIGWCGSAYAQVLTVTDKETNEPLEMVALMSMDSQMHAITNAKGQADISAFKGYHAIEIHALGYKNITSSYAELKSANFEVALEPSQLNLDEVVVSASRWRQSTSNVPSKITTLTPKDVSLQNPQTAADLLGISGEVFIQKSQQGGGSPMIRGFATNRLLYTVDGVRMNTAIFRGGNIQNVISMDPFAMESTEVLFGPGSVIYGSDAIGGVMSFQTLTPQLSLSDKTLITGKAVTRYSSASNEKTGHFDINVGWKKWAMVTSISANDYGHLRQGSHGPDDYLKPYNVQRIDSMDRIVTQDDPLLQKPSAYSQMNLMQKVRFRPNERWDFQYGFHFSETSSYGRYDRHNRTRNGGPRYAEWKYGPQKWMMNHLQVTNEANNAFYDQVTLRLAQQSFEESRISRSFGSPDRKRRIEEVEAYSANLDFVKSMGARNSLYYGVEYVLNDVNSTGIDENIETGQRQRGPARYPQSEWSSIAVYLNDEFQLSKNFTLQTGVRYNQFMLDARFDTTFYPFDFTSAHLKSDALTGSIGGVWRPTESLVISANFGTAFRSPNVDDVGKIFDSEPGAVTVPNPDLAAEYAYNFDLGIAKVFWETIKLDLTGYYTILNNAMVRRDYLLNGRDSIMYDGVLSQVQAIRNAAEATVYGVQAGLEVKLPANFSFSSDLNYQVGEEELEDGSLSPSRHAAPLFGVARFSYRAHKLNLQVNAQYQGERRHEDISVDERGKTEIYALDEDGSTYAPAWYTLNVKAQYQFTDHLMLSAGIENITDQLYRPYSSGLSGPGRNFVMSLQAGF